MAGICFTSILPQSQARGTAGRYSSFNSYIFYRLAALCLSTLVFFFSRGLQAQATNSIDKFQVLQAAADKGDAKAQCELGDWYEKQHSYVKAVEYWRKSAGQSYAPGEVALGSAYGRARGVGRNIATAISWYRKAAEQGDSLAQYAMGRFYASGRGVTNDLTQAIQWGKKAAEQNQADAEEALGEMYLLPPVEYGTNYLNYPEGLRLLRQAAAQGSAPAMNNLGVAYLTGTGVTVDQNEAVHWFGEAAEHGDPRGQANFGQSYLDGRGVKRDPVQAYKWFKLSALQGCFLGTKGLDDCSNASLLKPKELAEAEQMVLDFQARQATNQIQIN